MKRWAWLVLLIPIGLYIPNLDRFAFPIFSEFSDLLITHWPNAFFINQAVFLHHEVPLWNNSILAGYPFFANPLAGLFYLPGWITNIAPYPVAFNGLFLAHIFAGSLAIYLTLRDEGFPTVIALLGGITFELMPKIWAHFSQGHISLVYAVCLTPWLLFVTGRAFKSNRKSIYRFLPAFIIAGVILADPRWLPYALVVWVAFFFYRSKTQSKIYQNDKKPWIIFYLSQLVLGLLLSAVLILPMVEYTQLSTRSLLTLEDNLAFSLPISKIALILFPSTGITAEWVFYLGGIGIISLIICAIDPGIRKRSSVWLLLFTSGIILAISGSIPEISKVWGLPGLNLIRVPSRALFLCGIAACFLIPLAVQGITERALNKKRTNLVLAACAGFGGTILLIVFLFSADPSMVGLIHGSAYLVIYSFILFLMFNNRLKPNWIWLIIGILLLDFYIVNSRSARYVDSEEALSQGRSFLNYINSHKDTQQRIFSPSDSISQSTAMLASIEMVNGIDPMQLIALIDFLPFRAFSGRPVDGYSVTFPPFQTGNPQVDNQNMVFDTAKLGLLNVKYLISSFPIQDDLLELVEKTNDGFIYENLSFRPRAWIQNSADPLGENILEIPELKVSPNEIRLFTRHDGLLVLSEVFYPGWKAYIDNQPVEIIPLDGLLRGIIVPDGEHDVFVKFKPDILWVGLGLSIMTLAGIIIYLLIINRITHD